jgi:FMN phosphatase YigB (HAD superfamily)
LLFDLGGVVMALDWERMFESWAAASGTSAAELRRRFSFDAHYRRYERCEIDERTYFASLRETLGIDIDDAQFEEGWGAIFAGEIKETVELIRALRGKIPMYAFSNTNLAHHAVWSRKFAHALALFDDVYISCTLGARKPEREAFVRVARAMKTAEPNILFFDDTPENVVGARQAGLQAVLVESPRDVRDALSGWL